MMRRMRQKKGFLMVVFLLGIIVMSFAYVTAFSLRTIVQENRKGTYSLQRMNVLAEHAGSP